MMLLVNVSYSFKFIVLFIGEKIGDGSSENDGYLKPPVESLNKLDTDNEIREVKPSKFTCLKRGILVVFSWIVCFLRIWNIFSYCMLPSFCRRKREIFDL